MEAESTQPPTPTTDQAQATTEASPDALVKELEEAKAKAAENLEGWQRERATFANYKRRVEKEQAETYQNAVGRVMNRYLDVLDDFDRAMKDKPAEGDVAKWAEGITLIYRKFQNVIEAEGITAIEGVGQPFDPNLHEAITHEDSADHPSGHVIGVARKGYKVGERILRPALVRVAR